MRSPPRRASCRRASTCWPAPPARSWTTRTPPVPRATPHGPMPWSGSACSASWPTGTTYSGRWPPVRIALPSEHASPLATLGGVDAGGQNVHVAALARGLARRGAQGVPPPRRDAPAPARRVPLCPGVEVDHVDAGPPAVVPKDELLPHMDAFA